MVGQILAAVIVGFLAGLLARALLPGKQKMGFFMTVLLGIGGAIVGYFIFARLLGIGDEDKFDFGSLPGAVIGAIILLFAYERLIANRDSGAAPAGGGDSGVGTPVPQTLPGGKQQKRKKEKRAGQQGGIGKPQP